MTYKDGGWTNDVDEFLALASLRYDDPVSRKLRPRLAEDIVMGYRLGRKRGLSFIAGAQRMVGMRWPVSQSSHVISFRQDGKDVQAMAEVCGNLFAGVVAKLDKYQCAWFHRITRRIWVGRYQDLLGSVGGKYIESEQQGL